jgi:hypothetical protein
MPKPNKQKAIGIVEVRSFRCLPAKHIDLCRRIRFSASSFARDLQSEARTPRNSLNRSVIKPQAYPVRSRRLRRIEFSVHTGHRIRMLFAAVA